jgi:hypothetical protein
MPVVFSGKIRRGTETGRCIDGDMTLNPLPPANSRRPFCFRRLPEMRCSLALSELGSPAAVAEGGRSALLPAPK